MYFFIGHPTVGETGSHRPVLGTHLHSVLWLVSLLLTISIWMSHRHTKNLAWFRMVISSLYTHLFSLENCLWRLTIPAISLSLLNLNSLKLLLQVLHPIIKSCCFHLQKQFSKLMPPVSGITSLCWSVFSLLSYWDCFFIVFPNSSLWPSWFLTPGWQNFRQP